MAVAQGYGKTVTSGSVFAYDTGDTRNSYIGEPTANILSSPQFTSQNNSTVGDASITKVDFGEGRVGIQMVQTATTNIVSFTMPVNNTTPTSGATYTISAQVLGTQIGALVKSQITVDVNGVRHWLTNSNTWTTTTTESNHFFRPTQVGSWHIFTNTFTMPSGTLTNLTFGGFYRATGNFTLRIANAQFELKSHATPFVAGTRSSTQGLLPLIGNSTIDLSNVSFDSSAKMVFDGTNDYTVIGTVGITDYSQPFTMECIFKVDSAATWDNGFLSNIYGIAGSYAGMYGLFKNSNNAVGLQLRDATTTSYATATGLSKGSYYHLVGTWNGSNTMVLYVNGVVTQTTSTTKTGATDSSNLYIGGVRAYGGAAGNYYQGEIPIVKYYNRALTAAEINQNYLHYKTRFNLS